MPNCPGQGLAGTGPAGTGQDRLWVWKGWDRPDRLLKEEQAGIQVRLAGNNLWYCLVFNHVLHKHI